MCEFEPTSGEPPILDLAPASHRAGLCSVSTRDRDMSNFRSQDIKIRVLAHGVIVEAVVWVRQE